MQFTISATFLALIGSAFAQTANFDAITSPTKDQELVADGKQSYKIVWEPTPEYDGQDVSILLLQGASQETLDFYPGANVASSVDSALGTYTWTPDSSIAGYATYGLKLQLDSNTTVFQYSFPFKIKAGSASPVSSSVSNTAPISTKTTDVSSSSSSSAIETSVPSKDNSVSTATTPVSASVTSSIVVPTGPGSTTGSGSGVQTTLTTATTATRPTSTGSASSSSTSAIVTAGAGRVMAGGFAAIGGVMVAVLAL